MLARVRARATLLTDSEDASLLLHALLDACVDHALPVVGTYAARIDALERRVLAERTPKAAYSRELHLLAGDLAVLRRTMVPTQQLVHKLRGAEPAVPLAATVDPQRGAAAASPAAAAPPPPFISPLARTYLSDVLDHVETAVDDIDALAAQSGDIVALVFSSISLSQNSSLSLLAVVSALFLVRERESARRRALLLLPTALVFTHHPAPRPPTPHTHKNSPSRPSARGGV